MEQREIDEGSPNWVRYTLEKESTPPEYSDVNEYLPSSPFTEPKWTVGNGWLKYHASGDCGGQVLIAESPKPGMFDSERYSWDFFCSKCGRKVSWRQILYLNRDWYSLQFSNGHLKYKFLKFFKRLNLLPEYVIEAGPLPNSEEVREAIRKSYYKGEAEKRLYSAYD